MNISLVLGFGEPLEGLATPEIADPTRGEQHTASLDRGTSFLPPCRPLTHLKAQVTSPPLTFNMDLLKLWFEE